MKIKKISQLIFRRVVIVALLLLLQIATMVVFQVRFSSYSSWFYFASVLASLLAVFAILTSRANPAYKIAWIILIMAFPIFGGPFYLLFGTSRLSRHTKKKMAGIMQGLRENPLTEIAGYKVVSVTDYTKPEETGLPSANVLIYKLENNETVIVRPSGTEPKIKIYYTTLGKDLAEAQAEKDKLAEALKPVLA